MNELIALLVLSAVPYFGPAKIKKIMKEMTASEFVSLSPCELHNIGLKPNQISAITQPNQTKIEQALAWTEQVNCHLISINDPLYPPLLKDIHDPAAILYVRGDPCLLCSPQVAIVGSRHASQTGLQAAYSLSKQLVANGISITSGLALGVDGRAHQAALDGNGITIAVMATGPDIIYPKRHQYLAQKISETGVVLCENPLGSQAFAGAFPRRNRLISGLSLGCLVVEAANKSGSLITARMAMEQGREVFAVPGAINNPMADGCNALIQQGAKLISSAADIIEELPASLTNSSLGQLHNSKENKQLSLPLDSLLVSVGHEVTSIDEVAIKNQLSVADVSARLVELELEGLIFPVPGGYVRVRRDC